MNNNIFCIIPAYNEEKTIKKVVMSLKPIINNIIVVDDGSSDKTYERASETGTIIIKHLINRGQGAALQTGNFYALDHGAEIIVHFDADDQFLPSDIHKLIKPIINNDADIVFGSRLLKDTSSIPFLKRRLLMPIARLVNIFFSGKSLRDPQNGFRALSRAAAQKIFIKSDGMAHNSEIQFKTFKLGLRYKEVPVTIKYNKFGQGLINGKGRGAGGLKIVKNLILGKLLN